MFGLNETAMLYRHTGQSGGKPAYESTGIAFACRSQPVQRRDASGRSLEDAADTRFFAQSIEANPGDRIVCNDVRYIVCEVQQMRAARTIHHLEILARRE